MACIDQCTPRPRARYKLRKRWNRAALGRIELCSSLNGEALAARFVDAGQRRRAECDPAGLVFALPAIHKAPVTRRPDPHTETRMTRVPDRIFAGRRRQPRDSGVCETPPLRGHASAPQDSADGINRLAHHRI